ncbi:MAG: BatD family protein, partial [Candidatus Melainabacteria bacterium]|nr:BatD family protein [Candidatus Melainabacteria bacterium]
MRTQQQCQYILETAAQRAVSRLRRTNDRSVPSVHEDHEDDENAENGVVPRSLLISLIIISLFPLPLKAAITGSLTRNPIYLDESTDLIIDLDSSGEEALKFPLHTNSYDVVARQSSSSITIINNKFIQTKQLAYTLRFRRSGTFTLPI